MNKNQTKEIIMRLAGDPELLKEFLGMVEKLEEKPSAVEKNISLYAVKRHTADGKEYYHPIVVPKHPYSAPTSVAEDYGMMADENLVRLQNANQSMIQAFTSMLRETPIVLTIPEKTYHELEEKLVAFVGTIFDKIEEAANTLMEVKELTGANINTDIMKASMLSEIVGKMKIAGQCLNEEMKVEDAHEYVDNHEDDDCDDDDDDDYEDDDCDDDDDYDDDDYDEDDDYDDDDYDEDDDWNDCDDDDCDDDCPCKKCADREKCNACDECDL